MIDEAIQFLYGSPIEGTMAWTAGWLIRGSLFLLLLVLLAGPLARTRSSSVRHLLWAAGFAAILALPLASVGLPTWEVAVPAAVFPSPPASDSEGAAFPIPSGHEVAPEEGTGTMEPSLGPSFVTNEGVGIEDRAEATAVVEPPTNSAGVGSGGGAWVGESGWDLSMLPLFLFLFWMIGAAFLLLRFAVSLAGMGGIVRRADRCGRPEWERILFELSDRMDLTSAPRLVVSDEVALPMTGGLLRPTIVLPPIASDWSPERMEAVLCHELAHIRRRDLLSHLLGHVVSALYWVNPLSWRAARQLRAECERACDDLVLSLGYRPSAYADHLLQIATFGQRGSTPIAALPMARPGEFEQRLLSILAPIGNRNRLMGWRAAAVALGVLAISIPFAIVAPSAALGAPATLASDAAEGASEEGWGGSASTAMSVEEADTLSNASYNFKLDIGTSLDLEVLASFVQGVTSFASEIATAAVTSALSDLSTSVSASVGASGQDQVEGTFERTLSLTGPLNLEIETGSGSIEVREGAVNRIEIRARVRVGTRRRGNTGAEAALRQLIGSPPIEQSGNTVQIGRIEDRSLREDVSISYEVVVPVRSTIAASTGSGGVTIRGVQGDMRATTGSGSVTLTAIRGVVYARTGSGSIRASEIAGPFDGGTGSGSIDLTQQGTGDVSLTTGSGSVAVSGVQGGLKVETGSGRISAQGTMGGPWNLRTGSGSVSVDLPAQSAFNLYARTSSGRVNIDHPLTIQGRIDERMREVTGTVRGGGPELNIRTGSGGIRID